MLGWRLSRSVEREVTAKQNNQDHIFSCNKQTVRYNVIGAVEKVIMGKKWILETLLCKCLKNDQISTRNNFL